MKRFTCPQCGHEVHFDSLKCVRCGQPLALLPSALDMRATDGQGRTQDGWVACRNIAAGGCNWLAAPGSESGYCTACEHNKTVPNLDNPSHREKWKELELAKRQLIFELLSWSLDCPTKAEEPETGLAFDFLADTQTPDGKTVAVSTGHSLGLITLNIAEGDEIERAERKRDLHEPYRTVIGHLRHEIGHYYWMRLVHGTSDLEECRRLFGDDRADYGEALQTHYAGPPPAGWQQSFISAYATAHPWEDFAETWAHWMHIVDGLETAEAYGVFGVTSGQGDSVYRSEDVEHMIGRWVHLTVTVNSLNRGMGQPDFYPFVLSDPVIEKMRFINRLIHKNAAKAPGVIAQ
ncbi:putative zinc-binding metallopeptidase [Vannielia sp.]|uniref:zinc-binding metallopeptidase family protein n=1 Tax=Vannielia sp. TaxID=2813045 RepID=UPI0026346F83|nr:putative zinc-binding metallopeptidase [Vannielia sp.]MDF1872386.1 putative zinc-binding metallopeptidase [Vannielia sp.]